MSVTIIKASVENKQIRLPEKAKVYVVIPDAEVTTAAGEGDSTESRNVILDPRNFV